MKQEIDFMIDLFYFLMDAIIIFYVMQSTLEYKYKSISPAIVIISLYSIFLLKYGTGAKCPEFFNIPMVGVVTRILVFLSLFFIIHIFFLGKYSQKLMSFFDYIALLSISEIMVILFFSLVLGISKEQIMQSEYIVWLETGVSKILQLFGIDLIRRIKGKKEIKHQIKLTFEIGMLLFYHVLIIVLCVVFIRWESVLEENKLLYGNLLLVVIFFIFVSSVVMIFKLRQKAEYQLELQLKLKELELEKRYGDKIEEMEYNLRSLRHDMNNHINVMVGLLNMKEYHELREYFSEINEEIEEINEVIILENKALAVLLNEKIVNAKGKGISLEVEVSRERFLFPMSELCALVGNLLDNAIEAVEKVQDNKYIYFRFYIQNGMLKLQCENPYIESPIQENGKFITIKKNVEEHGFGTRKIREIIEKHQGTLEITCKNLFKVKIEIPLELEETTLISMEQEGNTC